MWSPLTRKGCPVVEGERVAFVSVNSDACNCAICKCGLNENISVFVFRVVDTYVPAFLNAYVSAVLGSLPFFSLNFHLRVFVYLHWKKAGNGQSLDKTGRQTDEHAKMWPKERKARLKTRKDKRRKRQRELGWWRKWRETGPLTWPHLHTWASLSLPAVHCGRLREDTLAHIYTYLRMLAMRTYLACVNVCACVCEHKCVFGCDSLSMRAKESANATRNPTVCVCFSFQPFSLCFHIPEPVCTSVHVCLCVYIYLHVRWSVLVVISICFSCSATRVRRILVCSVSPWSTPSSQSLHCASRLWTISNVEHKWSN